MRKTLADDGGQQLYRLLQLFPPPDFVKEATLTAPPADAGPGVYADPVRLRYPCHTAADTWLSAAAFGLEKDAASAADAAAIATRLRRFAHLHQISDHVFALEGKVAAATAVADEGDLPDDAFAFVAPAGERHFPMRNPDEIRKAAEYLVGHRSAIRYPVRAVMAERIAARAEAGDVELPTVAVGELAKMAGRGLCSGERVAAAMLDRVRASRQGAGALSAEQTGLLKLAEAVATAPRVVDRAGVAKGLAETIDAFDRHYGLAVGGQLPHVEDVLFGLTRDKLAAAVDEHARTVTGDVFRVADVGRLKVADLHGRLADDLIDALTDDGFTVSAEKAAAVLPTLPRPDAAVFAEAAARRGVTPVLVERTAVDPAGRAEYMRQLAGLVS